MDELAQLVGACELDPYVTRSGKQGLFEPPHYDIIFDNRSVEVYLSIFWLGRAIKNAGSGYPDRAYAKWHALHFLWKQISSILNRRKYASEFRRLSERREAPTSIRKAAIQVYLGLEDFYRKNRGSGKKATDISNFFYRPHQHRAFAKYWKSRANNRRRVRLTRYISSFKFALRSAVDR